METFITKIVSVVYFILIVGIAKTDKAEYCYFGVGIFRFDAPKDG